MDIVVFGANGQTGRLLTRRGLDKGHYVLAKHPAESNSLRLASSRGRDDAE